MCAHNYDGDVLTDEISQIHRSPGFLTSVLNGVKGDGTIIKEFEASHGTVTDMWHDHLKGKETSLNPLSMMEALIGAIQHSVELRQGDKGLSVFASKLRRAIHQQMVKPGKATRDLSGPIGLTTEEFVAAVKVTLDHPEGHVDNPPHVVPKDETDDLELIKSMFRQLDLDGDGVINLNEFAAALKQLGVTPKKL